MSEKKPMDSAMRSLQAELDRMAADVPEMPDSYRQGWREAVRREAAAASESRPAPASSDSLSLPSSPDPEAKAAAGARYPSSSRGAISWRQGLGIAAAVVFILGGVLLGQGSVSLVRKQASEAGVIREASPAPVSFSFTAQPDAAYMPDAGSLPESASPAANSAARTDQAGSAEDLPSAAAAGAAVFKSEKAASPMEGALSETAEEAAVPEPDKAAFKDTIGAKLPQDTAGEEEIRETEEAAFEDTIGAKPLQDTAGEKEIRETEEVADMLSAKKEEESVSASSPLRSPLRIAGFFLIGLAALIAVFLLIRRK